MTAPTTPEAKQWSGWGTALKPSQEPAVLARKPLEGTVADNVLKWGTGGLNIDACRIPYGDISWPGPQDGALSNHGESGASIATSYSLGKRTPMQTPGQKIGRWPANIYHCPKPSRSEREKGCEESPKNLQRNNVTTHNGTGNYRGIDKKPLPIVGNYHPTVKPTNLMRWLVRLVTPKDGIILEPFCGSGTTLLAAELEGFNCTAIEREPKYCDIIRARFGGMNG